MTDSWRVFLPPSEKNNRKAIKKKKADVSVVLLNKAKIKIK
jgi:hypothetical protein